MTVASKLFPLLEAAHFDVVSGLELCGGDPDFYCDLIRELSADVLPQSAALLNDTDLGTQREFAHKLKGTLSTLGERRACQTALELERSLRQERPDAVLTARLLSELQNLRNVLAEAFA